LVARVLDDHVHAGAEQDSRDQVQTFLAACDDDDPFGRATDTACAAQMVRDRHAQYFEAGGISVACERLERRLQASGKQLPKSPLGKQRIVDLTEPKVIQQLAVGSSQRERWHASRQRRPQSLWRSTTRHRRCERFRQEPAHAGAARGVDLDQALAAEQLVRDGDCVARHVELLCQSARGGNSRSGSEHLAQDELPDLLDDLLLERHGGAPAQGQRKLGGVQLSEPRHVLPA
jgi:hypothetical protein